MAFDIGPRIGIEGEKEFKNAVSDIGTNLKVLGSELKKVSAEFGDNTKSVEALTAKSNVYIKQIDEQKNKINTLKDAIANATITYGENSSQVKEWQIKLNNAEAELSKTESALKDVKKELVDTDKVTKESSETFEKFSATTGKVGIAVAGAVVAIAAASAAAGTALAKMSIETAMYADNIITMAAQTRVSTQTLQEYTYAAQLVDVSVETLTGSMARQIRSMASAQDGSKQFTEAYNKLGVSVTDVNSNLRDSETVYWEAIDALKQVGNETERDAIAMQLFGKSAQELNPIIAQGSAGMKAFAAEAHAAGAVLSDDTLKAFGEFDDAIQRLTQGAEAAKRALGGVLLPQVSELATVGKDLLTQFTNGLNEAGDDMGKVGELVGDLLGDIIKKLSDMMPKAIEMGTSIVTSLGKAMIDNLPQMSRTGIDILLSVIDGITKTLPELVPSAVNAITTVIGGIVENLPRLLDAGLAIIEALGIGIIDSLPDLVKKLPEILYKIAEFIINAIPDIAALGVKLFSSLWENNKEIEADMKKAIAEFMDLYEQEWNKQFSTWESFGQTMGKAILQGLLSTPLGMVIKLLYDIGKEDEPQSKFAKRYQDEKGAGGSNGNQTYDEWKKEKFGELPVNLSAEDKENVKETTNAIKENGDKNTLISDAISQAGINANDTTQEAAKKILDKIEENTRKAEIIAAATRETARILERNSLANWDPKTQSYIKDGGGVINWGNGKVTNIPGNAAGTNFFPGGLSWINEEARTKGPELVSLPRGSQIYSADETKEMLSGKTINNHQTLNFYEKVQSPYETAKQAKRAMQQLIYNI